jgi:hypothetical protein
MKILANDLYKALKSVKITDYNKYLPVLNHVFFCVEDGCVHLFTTNLEDVRYARTGCISGNENWSTCVLMVSKYMNWKSQKNTFLKGYPLLDFIKICEDDLLEFNFEPETQLLKITGKNYHTVFKCIVGEEFPLGSTLEILNKKEIYPFGRPQEEEK